MKIETLKSTTVTGCSQGPQRGVCNRVQNSRVSRKYKYIGYPQPHKSGLGDGTHGAGPLRIILHINSWPASYLICKNGHFTYLQQPASFIHMLSSCGHAFSQGDGCEFNPCCNWEAAPLYSTCGRESLEMVRSTPPGQACQD